MRAREFPPYSPIPGAGYPPRGLFVDRWGTLLEPPADGPAHRFNQVELTPGSLDALFQACQAGWNLYLMGNEDAVAQGKVHPEEWTRLQDELIEHMRAHGVPVTRCYACLDNPEGKPPHDRDSVYLLPNTGVLYHAAQNDGIELSESWVIGDGTLELVAGWRAGCHLAGIGERASFEHSVLQVEPTIVAPTLAEALAEITTGAGIPYR